MLWRHQASISGIYWHHMSRWMFKKVAQAGNTIMSVMMSFKIWVKHFRWFIYFVFSWRNINIKTHRKSSPAAHDWSGYSGAEYWVLLIQPTGPRCQADKTSFLKQTPNIFQCVIWNDVSEMMEVPWQNRQHSSQKTSFLITVFQGWNLLPILTRWCNNITNGGSEWRNGVALFTHNNNSNIFK